MTSGAQRIVEQSRPLLHEGEVVAHVIKALEGPNRWAGMLVSMTVAFVLGMLTRIPLLMLVVFFALYTYAYARRAILATDEGLVVVGCSRLGFRPKVVLDRLPEETKIGPLRGLWLQTHLNGRRLYVVARSAKEVQAADAEVDTA